MRLLALGGCGGMGVFAVRTALRDELWADVVIADLDGGRADRFARECGDPRVRARILDASDPAALDAALADSDVVLNCVGPYYRFGVPILERCLAAGRHYLDLNDDWEPTLEMLDLDAAARDAGATAVVGMGASPGLSNLLAVLAARELDRVDTLHTIWGIGENGLHGPLSESEPGSGGSYGAAMEHWLQQLTGTIRVVRDGALVEARPLEAVPVDLPGCGRVTCHSVGHPEPATLIRSYPGLRSSLNLMDMPRSVIALLRRLSRRVDRGELGVREAAKQVEAVLEARPPRLVFSRTGLGMVLEALLGTRHLPELCALATGDLAGRPARVGAALTAAPPGGMGAITGIPAAIGLGLLARGEARRRGVLPPEEAFEPESVMKALAPHCRGLPSDGGLVRIEREIA
ncbi:MAG: saccharopine dehydrogenase NADP-binding domain-containing protein [Myxococcota bacterium]|nr:saccharopine dehydrogenase NADP-binding domain-containing protein [Myxococcota bacterium]